MAALALLLIVAASGQTGARAADRPRAGRGAHHGSASKPRRQESTAHTAVIDGGAATVGSWPWLAFVANVQASAACSGTVISPMVVLTAAHCVEDVASGAVYAPAAFRVVTGTVDWSAASAAQVATVAAVEVDPGFDRATLVDDAAILILTSATKAPALTLATADDGAPKGQGTPAAVAGWGDTYSSEATTPTTLHWGATVVQGQTFCANEAYIDGVPFDPSSALCALDAPTLAIATCHGDSGGPLVATDAAGAPIEIGVTSRGDPNCNPDFPSVFTRADVISAWAQSVVAANPPPSPQAVASTAPAAAIPQAPAAAIKLSPSTRTPNQGLYTARTSQRGDVVAVKIAGAGANRASVEVTFALFCPGRHVYSASLALAPRSAAGGHWRFSSSGVDSHGQRYSISGSFRPPQTIAGTFRVSAHEGRCSTGLVSWSAHADPGTRAGALRNVGRPAGLDIRLSAANKAGTAGIPQTEAQSTTEKGDDSDPLSNTTQLRRSRRGA